MVLLQAAITYFVYPNPVSRKQSWLTGSKDTELFRVSRCHLEIMTGSAGWLGARSLVRVRGLHVEAAVYVDLLAGDAVSVANKECGCLRDFLWPCEASQGDF